MSNDVTTYASAEETKFGTVDVQTGEFSEIQLDQALAFLDIATLGGEDEEDQQLLGVIEGGDFYRIDPDAGTTESAGSTELSDLFGLGTDEEGNVFGAESNDIYSIEFDANGDVVVADVGDLPGNISGDIAYSKESELFYLTVDVTPETDNGTDNLVSWDPVSGNTVNLGDIGFGDVFGLTWYEELELSGEEYENVGLGFTNTGEEILIDPSLSETDGPLGTMIAGGLEEFLGAAAPV